MQRHKLIYAVIITALMGMGFSKDSPSGPDCSSKLYWFHVKSTVTKTLCNSIILSDLDEVLDPNQNCILDPGEANSALVYAYAFENPYGCQDTNNEVCALGYLESQLTVINRSGLCYIVPSNVQAYRCCIKRPESIPL